MIKTIVFGTDFSPISDRAQQYVLQIAGATGASVVLVYAVEPPPGGAPGSNPQDSRYIEGRKEKAGKMAEPALEAFRSAGVKCSLQVPIEKRWKALVEAGDSEEADLIVIGSHSISEDGKLYLGTTSHKVFFSTDKPLMVVPQG